MRSEAWVGAERFRCALTTVGALLQQRGITDVDLLKVCGLRAIQHMQWVPARQAEHFLQ